MDTQQQIVTNEDRVAETVLLAQQLPVGTYWKDDKYVYQINNIKLGSIASAECTRVSNVSAGSLYDYSINENIHIFVRGIANLIQIELDEYNDAVAKIARMVHEKNTELFNRQCLLSMPTDTPFEDFETLHDEIIELDGFQYFFYKPLRDDSKTCFRVMRIDMNTYDGASTLHDGWHFYMDDNHILAKGPGGKQNTFGEITGRHKVYPITEYQFNGLVEFIEAKPNQA